MNTRNLFTTATLSVFAPTFAFADLMGEEKALEIISTGIIVNGAVGAGSSYRDDKQAVYVVHEGTLYFCNLFTQKKRSETEAVVASECFRSSQ